MKKTGRTPLSHLFYSVPPQTLGSLAPEATYATVQFCIEADDMPEKEQSLEIFKHVRAKLIEVPVENVIRAIMATSEISSTYQTFDEYHQWYLSHGDTPSYTSENRWPCISSTQDDEVVDDGSHRLHAYIRAGAKTIPLLEYDYNGWWQVHKAWIEATGSRNDRQKSD